MGVLANTSEDIQHFAPVWFRVLNAVRRDDRQSIGPGKIDQLSIDLLFAANEMPLNLDKHILPSKRVDQSLKCALQT